ncbi:MAG: Nitrilase/cyanide hydratase and apolipoprotein N-acyltransferase [Bacteroidetes bacterium]|jgi:predicted amidohydrolase|nr:Nitrilase/cyanide hydratase and apolipoprotein N-acyltransferase [Bacteroidota bacterium]
MNDLKITTVQTHLCWEDVARNLTHFDEKLDSISQATDIIVLPEMFTTGFTMKPEALAEEHGGKGLLWMQRKAAEKNCIITGSISVKQNELYYNRLYWVKPDGTYEVYDKRHLFRMGNEHQHYTAGEKKLIVEYKGWKICPMVCYDIRFPVWSRNIKENTYDVLLYVANWPEVRSYPWRQLLIARAIENQAFVVGVNRVGEDGNGISHSGDSCIINPRGEVLVCSVPHQDVVETQSLSYLYLEEFRKAFPVMLDGDEFIISKK